MPDRVAFLERVEPMRCVGTWPVMHTSGTESIMASVRPVTAFVAPGPGGHEHHADLAGGAGIALAACTAACSWRTEDVAHLLLVEQRVVDREHRAAG
jgi:hypothetical protein